MKDKTELLSFFNADHIYTPSEINDLYVDLEVTQDILIGITAKGERISLGLWPGALPLDLGALTINPEDDFLVNEVSGSGQLVETLPGRKVKNTPVTFSGVGRKTGVSDTPITNETPDDYHPIYQDLYYAIAQSPQTTSVAHTRVETTTGVVVTCTPLWNTVYQLYNLLNREVSTGSDGPLSNSVNFELTFMFPTPIPFCGYVFHNLRDKPYSGDRYIIETTKDGVSWDFFEEVDYSSRRFEEITKIVDTNLVDFVLGIRWKEAPGNTGYPGVGRFEILTTPPGKIVKFKPLEFLPSQWNKELTPEGLVLSPKVTDTGAEPPRGLSLNSYLRVSCTSPKDDAKTGLKAEFIADKIECNTLSPNITVPRLNIPKGKYSYRYTACLRREMGKAKLSIGHVAAGGVTDIVHGMFTVGPGTGNPRSITRAMTGELNLWGDTDITLRYISEYESQLIGSGDTNTVSAVLELWKIAEVPDMPEETPLALPSPGMLAAEHRITRQNYGAEVTKLTDGDIAEGADVAKAGWTTRNKNDYLEFTVSQPFRLWVVYGDTNSTPELFSLTRGGLDLSSKVIPSTGLNREWQQLTHDLPPGSYGFRFLSNLQNYAFVEWFFELVTEPNYNPVVITQQTLGMFNNGDMDQLVEQSSFLEAGKEGYRVFTGGAPALDGWVTGAGKLPSVVSPEWLTIRFISGRRKVSGYTLANRTRADAPGDMQAPEDFELQGLDEFNQRWVHIHAVSGRDATAAGEVTKHKLPYPVSYACYRLLVTKANAGVGNSMTLGRFQLILEDGDFHRDWLK